MEINKERRDAILKLRNNGKTYGQISKELNCTKSLVAFYCNPNRYEGIEKDKEKEKAKQEYENLVCSLVKECDNINQVCKALGKRGTNTNLRLIKDIINKYNIDISHFNVNYLKRYKTRKYTIEEIFCKNSKLKTNSELKKHLLKNNFKEYRCECCNNTEWNGKPIPLQTHHINGDNTDNRIENLQLLCPNCHAITDTYCGKNIKTKLPEKHKERICPICGKVMYGKGNKFCSDKCFEEWRKRTYIINKSNITKEKLIKIFKEKKNFRQVGAVFGVSDKTISKWCKNFGLPNKSKEMKEYLDNI